MLAIAKSCLHIARLFCSSSSRLLAVVFRLLQFRVFIVVFFIVTLLSHLIFGCMDNIINSDVLAFFECFGEWIVTKARNFFDG